MAAYFKGKKIVDTCAGTLGDADPRPVQPNSLFNVFSVTKALTAVALHQLVDRGLVRLDGTSIANSHYVVLVARHPR